MAPTLGEASAQPRNNFNLIRLLAAWAVIYGHSFAVTGSGEQDLVVQWLQFKFSGGIAVDVFFVVSGFLIAASLERNRLPAFLTARALRILPALVVCAALSAFVLGPLLTTVPDYWTRPDPWRYFFANATLAHTEYFLPGVFAGLPNPAINGSLWSLPIEARLYLVLAALGLLSLARRERFNPLYILAMVAGWLWLSREPLRPDISNYAYCTAFFLTGSFAWFNRDGIRLSWPLLLGILVFAAALHRTDRFHVGYFLALSYGTLFLAYVPTLPVIRHHDLSYGLYLYGWPAQQLVQWFRPQTQPLGNFVMASLLAGALAAGSWFLVEAPALRLKARWHVRRAPAAAPDDTLPREPAEAKAA